MIEHQWVRRVTTRQWRRAHPDTFAHRVCTNCGIRSYLLSRNPTSPQPRWSWDCVDWVYTWREPACPGFDISGPGPRAEVVRTFLGDGMSVERALELADLVLTEEAA